jgi:hypothetical protein
LDAPFIPRTGKQGDKALKYQLRQRTPEALTGTAKLAAVVLWRTWPRGNPGRWLDWATLLKDPLTPRFAAGKRR